DRASSRPVAARLRAAALAEPRLRYLRLPTPADEATAVNAGLRHSTGGTVLLLHHDVEPAADCLPRLLAGLAPDAENSDGSMVVLGVQPLLLHPDDSVECAGVVLPRADGLPLPFLAGHPPEDALRTTDRAFPAVSATALLMRAGDLVELRGLDASLGELAGADLCLRAARLRPGRFLVEPAARAWHHDDHPAADPDTVAEHRRRFLERWRGALPATGPQRWGELGFEVRASTAGDGSAQALPALVVRRPAVPGPLRWGLVLASPGGPEGDRWGDTHFGASLARALRAGGQEVVTYRHGAHDRGTASLDDVVLGIRGLDPVRPVPGAVSVLWVISHPDDVDPAELQDFDLVFAASAPWAREMGDRSGRPVGVLQQATDVSLRADLRRPVGTGDVPVFVGTTHGGRPRRIVADALATGVRFRAFGPWRGRIPDELVGGGYVPNERLGSLYREHGLVLADHHADMARHGFVANRLYDAVASGARVVTDPVAGLEVFEGAVQPYHDRAELAFLCSPQGRARFPDEDTMAAIADRVALVHSFDARARVLLEAVLDVRRERG
ncbi:MAG TPA: glycosyltransferase, partial [Nocardioides sp.]|uniref:glycosyltransferase family protein n=1 Tax=Nocardioides sp. TaxID=35761 RepID=UPI002C0EF14F